MSGFFAPPRPTSPYGRAAISALLTTACPTSLPLSVKHYRISRQDTERVSGGRSGAVLALSWANRWGGGADRRIAQYSQALIDAPPRCSGGATWGGGADDD